VSEQLKQIGLAARFLGWASVRAKTWRALATSSQHAGYVAKVFFLGAGFWKKVQHYHVGHSAVLFPLTKSSKSSMLPGHPVGFSKNQSTGKTCSLPSFSSVRDWPGIFPV
jgi:hypothetical protein